MFLSNNTEGFWSGVEKWMNYNTTLEIMFREGANQQACCLHKLLLDIKDVHWVIIHNKEFPFKQGEKGSLPRMYVW